MGIIFLNAFGIYLGRYMRFNSWDIISNPMALFGEIVNRFVDPIHHPGTWGMTLSYGFLFIIGYFCLKLFQRSLKDQAAYCQIENKQTMRILIVISFLGMFLFSCNKKTTTVVANAEDCKTAYKIYKYGQYTAVEIAENHWMDKNLNIAVSHGTFCMDDKTENCDAKGRLYTWEAAKEACPEGWHLATLEDWEALVKWAGDPKNALKELKTPSGFGLKFGGAKQSKVGFTANNEKGYFWTASDDPENKKNAFSYLVNDTENTLVKSSERKSDAFSCRCIKNSESK